MNKEHKEFYIRKLTFVPVRIYKECDPRLYLWHFNECIKDSIYHKNYKEQLCSVLTLVLSLVLSY